MTLRLPVRPLLSALAASALLGSFALSAVAAPPTTDDPPVYEAYPAIVDPGSTAPTYFQPHWYDTDGRHIQAHGGQIVVGEENGAPVYYWYGEDRSNDYYNSPGVSVYKSYDSFNWTNEGVALRSVSSKAQLTEPYFADLYDTIGQGGQPDQARIDELFYHLNVKNTEDDGTTLRTNAIFERPKVLYNDATDQWVMWWHSDGSTSPGGSNYARSLAGVAVSDSPTGPFQLIGAYRLYNETTYKTACNQNGAVAGGARDMTVFKDDDGSAYIVYSSEENRSLYIAKLNDDYTNVEKTTATDTVGFQFSDEGAYPYIFADGTAGAPVKGQDYGIVKRCGLLEAPTVFTHDGRYYLVTSGATGWRPNPQTYYTADAMLGTWIRGIEAGDAYENVAYDQIPEGGDGLLSYGDSRKTSFGSQSTHVFPLDASDGRFIYMGDRWNSGAANSTYVWLPMTFGENGRLEMRNPAVQAPQWATGWTTEYWNDKGAGGYIWTVTDDGLPASVRTSQDVTEVLPTTVTVTAGGTDREVGVTWSPSVFSTPGAQKITGTLAADADFTAGRTFTRTIQVDAYGSVNIAPQATVVASSRQNLAPTLTDGSLGKGWDDWVAGGGYPRSSTLSFEWNGPRVLDRLSVHTFKDGSTATWPSEVSVSYREADGTWVNTDVSTSVAQDASGSAPVVQLDLSTLPAVDTLRVNLQTATSTWQSIAEVEIFGYVAPAQPLLQGLKVDGQPIAGFDPAVSDYRLERAAGMVTADAVGGAEVEIQQATGDRTYAVVVARQKDGGTTVTAQAYRVYFEAASVNADLASLTIDGVPLAGFAPATTSYTFDVGTWGRVPAVVAQPADDAASVTVSANAARAVVTVTAEDTQVTKAYTISFSATGGCNAVAAPWTAGTWSAGSYCQGDNGAFRITDTGTGAWTNKDNLSVVWQPELIGVGDYFETTVAVLDRGSNSDSRAGLIVRNDLSAAGKASARGYALLVTSPAGVYLQHDANGNGYIDTQTATVPAGVAPVQLRLERTAENQVTGYYRTASGQEWIEVATVPLNAPDEVLDAGVFATGNNNNGPATATFVDTAFSEAEAPPSVVAELTTRCVAGKIQLVVTVTNPGDEAVAVSVQTPYGAKSFGELGAGRGASAAFATRLSTMPGGEVSITAGATVTTQPYPGAQCS
ncbi:MAG TPA: family 43 glycosylhydrolase [Arachnia sp.]|nr:family 43 glycosylhydrolase [Arachnia sp.]HMT86414.1 family 43 glycosylhydrolase [Arachnia sp.]